MPSARIQERGTVSGNQMRMARPIEDAAQTFRAGTPVTLSATTSGVQIPSGAASTPTNPATLTNIAGIAKEAAANLAVAGVPLGFTALPTGATAGQIPPFAGGGPTYGSVPNQPGAKNFLRPVFNDGRTEIVLAIPDTVFYGQIGPGPSPTPPAQTDIGKSYGLTLDADGVSWYIDRTKTILTGSTANACLQITGLDQWDTARGVLFTFLPGVAQLLS